MNRHRCIWAFTWLMAVSSAAAQTVGNGSAIAPSAGQREAYGVNWTLLPTDGQVAWPTRHYRRANESGIGGSTIGTTSPTSESSPAMQAAGLTQGVARQSWQKQLDLRFSQATGSPALGELQQPLSGVSGISEFTSPAASRRSFASQLFSSGLESIPSLSKQPSLTDQMRFDNFDLSGK